ncbi:NUDIX domain-containing protein [Streptomyces kaempferi]
MRDAALRELHEEAGIPPSAVVPLAASKTFPSTSTCTPSTRTPRRTNRPTTTWTSAGSSVSAQSTR